MEIFNITNYRPLVNDDAKCLFVIAQMCVLSAVGAIHFKLSRADVPGFNQRL